MPATPLSRDGRAVRTDLHGPRVKGHGGRYQDHRGQHARCGLPSGDWSVDPNPPFALANRSLPLSESVLPFPFTRLCSGQSDDAAGLGVDIHALACGTVRQRWHQLHTTAQCRQELGAREDSYLSDWEGEAARPTEELGVV